MKMKIWILAGVVLSASLSSCDDEESPPMVWGTLSSLGTVTDTGESGPITVNGATLGEGDQDLVGFCRYKDNKFDFAVGAGSSGPSLSSDFYFSIVGVEGPPSSKPYGANGEPREDEERTFESGNIRTGAGAWIFDQSDMIEGRCTAVLFSEAGSGDLTPVEYGKERFDYLVVIDCGLGLDQVPSQISPEDPSSRLRGFDLALWFKNCES